MIGANVLFGSEPVIKQITPEDKEGIKELKRINSIIFPQTYNDIFYRKLVPIANFHLVYVKGELIGSFSFLLKSKSVALDPQVMSHIVSQYENCCYIMNLGVLSVYRKQGFGRSMWNFIRDYAERYFREQQFEYCLHVQEKNKSAIRFYEKLGFQRISQIENYYRQLEGRNALVMARTRN